MKHLRLSTAVRKESLSLRRGITCCIFVAALIAIVITSVGKSQNEPSMINNSVANTSSFWQIRAKAAGEIPVLCYHNFTKTQNTNITLSRNRFEDQMKSLADSGYHSILPDDLYAYLTTGESLPPRPFILSFDDTRKAQYTIAEPVFRKYGFKAAFFIMTVCLDKRDYLSSANLKEFSQKGYCIAAHTYDHPMVSHIENKQWNKELLQPKLLLEKIVGHPVNYFAYPYGVWTSEAIRKLKEYGYRAAFQLAAKQSNLEPLFTIRRLMVQGNWTAKALHKHIVETFPKTFGSLASSGKARTGKNN